MLFYRVSHDVTVDLNKSICSCHEPTHSKQYMTVCCSDLNVTVTSIKELTYLPRCPFFPDVSVISQSWWTNVSDVCGRLYCLLEERLPVVDSTSIAESLGHVLIPSLPVIIMSCCCCCCQLGSNSLRSLATVLLRVFLVPCRIIQRL